MNNEQQAPATSTFASLGIADAFTAPLADKGIVHPFPIQQMAIPIALSGADMIGQARTGTGKTLAFGLPILHKLQLPGQPGFDEFEHYGKPQALVMAPTRELALQVSNDLKLAGARVVTIYGGVSYDEQLKALKNGVDVVVGTPGRLLDLANQKALELDFVRVLVLDEADEMLDLGFLPDVQKLAAMTPSDRQTLLFSATMPAPIVTLAREALQRPIHVRAEGADTQATVPDIEQFIYQAHDLDKPEIIAKLLQAEGAGKVMIFSRTKRSAQRLADELEDRGFKAKAIHGDLSQDRRERVLKQFRNDRLQALVATDVAARGIDVSGVTHVVNYEVPDDQQQYVHRIGRTGRAGANGVAVTLVDWSDVTRWNVINKALDLDFANPPEAYSTTPQLLADLRIPEGTKGRIAAARPESDDTDAQPRRRGAQRDSRREDEQDQPKRAARKRSNRNRRRTKNGQVVTRDGQPAEQQPKAE